MCGTVIDGNGVKKQLGGTISISHELTGIWQGFAREEALDKWLSGGWRETALPDISYFTEGKDNVLFTVPVGKVVSAIYHPNKKISGSHPINIITRASLGEELLVHPRMPRLKDKP